MDKYLLKKALKGKSFSSRRVFIRNLDNAVYSDAYENYSGSERVTLPQDIREEYFEIFLESAFGESITTEGRHFAPDFRWGIPFFGRASFNTNITLRYFPDWVDLEMSVYSFDSDVEERMWRDGRVNKSGIALISTHAGRGSPRTYLRVGKEFIYHPSTGNNPENGSMTKIIDTVRNSTVIPQIPESVIESLTTGSRWDKSKSHKY